MNQAQQVSGMRISFMPLQRRSTVVAIKLMAPISEAPQKTAMLMIQRVWPRPSPGPVTRPTPDSGGYAVQPDSGALCVASQMDSTTPSVVYMMTIDKAKFRKPVVPGDQVRFHMTRIAKKRNMWWFRGEAKVDDVLVCEAEVSAMLVPG